MTRQQLTERIRATHSYLCVGLDTDIGKIPPHLLAHADPVFEFNRQIIDATKDHCVGYKINTAFYESAGAKGWETMERTVHYIPSTHFRIADAKRGDIGNTSAQYAKAFFETMPFDAVTVAPYMGEDSVRPFLEYPNKWTILLGLTSNSGARDFELQEVGGGYLYEHVLRTATGWGTPDNLMFVIGATQAEWFERIRRISPDHFYLVPGVGSQGGSLREISARAMNKDVGLLVNVSRRVIYAWGSDAGGKRSGAGAGAGLGLELGSGSGSGGEGEDFAAKAGAEAARYQKEMSEYL